MEETKNETYGDIAVSRGVTVGGDVSVKGGVEVGHDLHVKGWLVSRSHVGAMRGLYLSGESLKKNNPRPRPGWFALVGNTLPAQVWISDGEEWTPTGKTGGTLTLYSEEIAALKREVSALRQEVAALRRRVDGDTSENPLNPRILQLEYRLRDLVSNSEIISSDIAVLKTDVAGLKNPAG